MANLRLKHVYKVYPNGVKAVNDFTMDIDDKEFIVFVGPSGCGKSTTLRMIAGLEDITAGEISIDDLVVNDVEPKDRDIAMVFQNYALYPHMTVYENMAFGLKLRNLSNEEIHKRVLEAAEILGITDYLDRKPRAMSGGQRQRVALGRAIVRNPKVFLLDEPLSNLDAKLRTQMRSEISKLHQKLGTTFIYVTHDQTEAMTLGTRIVVMKDGYIQQIDTPRNLYNYPGNKFVAGFIGTPQMNFFEVTLKRKGDMVEIDLFGTKDILKVPYGNFLKVKPEYLNGKKEVVLGIRAEKVSCDPEDIENNSDAVVSCTVSHTEELGDETLVFGDLAGKTDIVGETKTGIVFKVDSERGAEIKMGNVVKLAFAFQHLHFFDKETEKSISPRVPEVNAFDGVIENNVLKFDALEFTLPKALETKDGEVAVEIPTDAFTFTGNQKVTCVKQETIAGTKLLHLQSGGRTFFAKTDRAVEPGELALGLDMKRISLFTNARPLHKPMQLKNILYGSVNRRVVKKVVPMSGDVGKNGSAHLDINGQGPMLGFDPGHAGSISTHVESPKISPQKRIRKVIEFTLKIADGEYEIPDEMLKRLVTGGGMNVFKKKLRFEFSPYAVRAGKTDGQITGTVEKALDYGTEQFAVVKVGDQSVTAKTDTALTGEVRLNIDLNSLIIIDDKVDMIIA